MLNSVVVIHYVWVVWFVVISLLCSRLNLDCLWLFVFLAFVLPALCCGYIVWGGLIRTCFVFCVVCLADDCLFDGRCVLR